MMVEPAPLDAPAPERDRQPPPRILVTGASGFLGRLLVPALANAGFAVRAASRRACTADEHPAIEAVKVPGLEPAFDLTALLDGVDGIVHLAGIAHASETIQEAEYMAVNAEATAHLARTAVHAAVRRFVFMSSVRAQTGPVARKILNESEPPRPTDAYGRSKLKAEEMLAAELSGTDTGWAALRPVLVYGPGVKGNMRALFKLARLPVPLPLAGVRAPRSLISVESLAGAVIQLLKAAQSPNGPLLAAEPDPMSAAEMVGAIRAGLGRKPGLVRLPDRICAMAAGLAGKRDAWERLASPLVIDPARLLAMGWQPAGTTREQLQRLASSGKVA